MPRPTSSIVTPAFNAGAFIEAAIASVLAQTYTDWELLVIDDGSTDDTAARVSRVRDPRIQLIRQPNAGLPSARNTALDAASGDYVALLDADDEFLPNHLALAYDRLERAPGLDAVVTDGRFISNGRELSRLSTHRRGPLPDGDAFGPVIQSSDLMAPPVAVVLRRSVIENRGLRFDPSLSLAEDWDYFARFAERSAVGWITEPTCRYRIHDSNMTTAADPASRYVNLAAVRLKFIGMDRFDEQTAEVRTAVLYDLLMRLLPGRPARRREVLQTRAFKGLPNAARSRLLRLVARVSLLEGEPDEEVSALLARAVETQPADLRSRVLHRLHRWTPRLVGAVLRRRSRSETRRNERAPFADVLAESH